MEKYAVAIKGKLFDDFDTMDEALEYAQNYNWLQGVEHAEAVKVKVEKV